ncbi:ATP-dependent rRNA helicase SPB4 [Candidozyma duobushaemuli]|uniref:ATP-dependent RNA helicase n=1 Tax=Candidozyma duobushaemuli TaxID=1231522 RepID=A0A2V1AFI7_9ASCO|nr:ATP-dependent rRNA helicase SPB4 [[Candida] duobushaemulonis]PVH16492.1 ATP-dependent rRNA helicase SPB4 [[Candida] duobushaemulonis]
MSLEWENVTKDLHPWLRDAVETLGFSSMTPVQASTIPLLSGNKDVVVQSVTGSGKTLAFVIPVLQHVSRILYGIPEKDVEPTSLKKSTLCSVVLSPTRELAFQIKAVFDQLITNIPDSLSSIKTQLVVGSLNSTREDIDSFNQAKPHIVIGTPGRVLDFLSTPKISAVHVEVVILDEADRLLDQSFETDAGLENVKFYSLFGQLSTTARLRTLKAFTDGDSMSKKHVLLTTDVAARGIDIQDVDLVIQLDPPNDPDVFLHRAGRTGRANKVGNSIVFLNDGGNEINYVDFMENTMPIDGWLTDIPLDMDKYAYADAAKEKSRLESLEENKQKMIKDAKERKRLSKQNKSWSSKLDSKELKSERNERLKRKREEIEKQLLEEPSDEEELAVDWKDIENLMIYNFMVSISHLWC